MYTYFKIYGALLLLLLLGSLYYQGDKGRRVGEASVESIIVGITCVALRAALESGAFHECPEGLTTISGGRDRSRPSTAPGQARS